MTVLLVFTCSLPGLRLLCSYSLMLVSGPVASVWTVGVLHGACCFDVVCVRCLSFFHVLRSSEFLCFWSWRPVFTVLPFFSAYVSMAIVCKFVAVLRSFRCRYYLLS